MCGIAGVISTSKQIVDSSLPAMTDCQIHRGPDSRGQAIVPFGQKFLGLGHRRLAIIDLSPHGHQPMVHPQTGDQLIFNGEIYNFQLLKNSLEAQGETFTGTGDSEVLLHALTKWGPDALPKLQGMYAFAFYDARRSQLLLARDPLGIKPLYISTTRDSLFFASEVRAILASRQVPDDLDPQAIAGYLAYGSMQNPFTLYKNIRSLPPGCFEIFEAKSENFSLAAPQRFWNFPAVDSSIAENSAVDFVRTTLDSAVRDHLIADVPVGVFLSSGLDSTIVAALASRHTQKLRSFTVGFADQTDMSELALAKQTAERFGLAHTEITIGNADAELAVQRWLASLDQPSLDGLNVYTISQAVRKEGITVALSGQGGDELFGGYRLLDHVLRIHRAMKTLGKLPKSVRAAMAKVATIGQPEAAKHKLSDMLQTAGGVSELLFQRRRTMSDAQLAAMGILPPKFNLDENYQLPESYAALQLTGDLIADISQLESAFYLHNTLLRDGDTNGMDHSLEIRVPMLDQRMLDFVYKIPGNVRLPRGRADKHLLRVAFADLFTPQILNQKKRGFTLPIKRWMLGPLRELCESSLATLKQSQLVDPAGVDALWNRFLKEPESPIWTRAFSLVVLGHYLARR